MMRIIRIITLALLLLPVTAGAVRSVTLFALFNDKAILMVDEARRVLAVGETSPDGVKLISADTQNEQAIIEMQGKRQMLKLGMVTATFNSPMRESVTLYADSNGFFHAEGSIDGSAVSFLVDTGANTIALNNMTAKRIGIKYREGVQGVAQTASGYVVVYRVKLNKVKIGDIQLHNIEASVTEGVQPQVPLLGMSFLSGLEMHREGSRMVLTKRY